MKCNFLADAMNSLYPCSLQPSFTLVYKKSGRFSTKHEHGRCPDRPVQQNHAQGL
jgi:hypothetical protein